MNIPSIRDNPIFYIGLLVAFEQAVSGGTIHLTNMIPADWIPSATAWATAGAFIGNGFMTALAAPSIARPPTQTVAKVIAWLVLPLAVAVLMVSPVLAQDRGGGAPTPRARPDAAFTLPDPLHLHDKDSAGSTSASPLDKPFQDLANFIGDDIDSAITLSTQIPSLQDGNGQQCLLAFKSFGEVIKAHPAPLTFKIASDLEAFRLKQMAVNRLCASDACEIVFSDITQTITALSPVPLPVPNMHDLCAKVPTIKVVAPVTPPTVPPAAPSTPAAPTQPPATNPNP